MLIDIMYALLLCTLNWFYYFVHIGLEKNCEILYKTFINNVKAILKVYFVFSAGNNILD